MQNIFLKTVKNYLQLYTNWNFEDLFYEIYFSEYVRYQWLLIDFKNNEIVLSKVKLFKGNYSFFQSNANLKIFHTLFVQKKLGNVFLLLEIAWRKLH